MNATASFRPSTRWKNRSPFAAMDFGPLTTTSLPYTMRSVTCPSLKWCTDSCEEPNRRKAMDVFSSRKRSAIMRKVGSKNTKPELALRSALHRRGHRYGLHARDLPGTPDLVFRSRKVVIQVRGCFWHGHACANGRQPKSRKGYWGPKLDGNKRRDQRNDARLRRLGWTVIVVWECRCGTSARLERQVKRISRILDSKPVGGG